jgi:hypothetical protein
MEGNIMGVDENHKVPQQDRSPGDIWTQDLPNTKQ